MRKLIFVIAGLLLAPLPVVAQQNGKIYSWTDENGQVHYSTQVPAEFAEQDKRVLNERGIEVDVIEGKKSAEELEAERIAREAEIAEEVKRRKDLALLGTYLTVEEIKLHRDRRVELFEAQTRVTELYLTNLERRLNKLKQEASHYTPYSPDPDAPMIDPELVADINETQATIDRHKNNLQKYQRDVAEIIRRFEVDITRFRELKGITQVAVDSASS